MSSSAKQTCEIEEPKDALPSFSETLTTSNLSHQANSEEPSNQSLSTLLQDTFHMLSKELESWLHHLGMSESYEKDIVAEVTALKDDVKKNNNFRREKIQQTMGQIHLLTTKPFEDESSEDL